MTHRAQLKMKMLCSMLKTLKLLLNCNILIYSLRIPCNVLGLYSLPTLSLSSFQIHLYFLILSSNFKEPGEMA